VQIRRRILQILCASRPVRPLLEITVPQRWSAILIAAGARLAREDDSMTVTFSHAHPDLDPSSNPVMKANSGGEEQAELAGGESSTPESGDELVCVANSFDRSDGIVQMEACTGGATWSVERRLREGSVVLMDVSKLADEDAARLIDFTVKLTFELSGSIAKVGDNLFLIDPISKSDITLESLPSIKADLPRSFLGATSEMRLGRAPGIANTDSLPGRPRSKA